MTTIALHYSTRVFNGVWSFVKTTLQGMMVGIMISRQTEANKFVAEAMINSGEWKRDEYPRILHELNQKTIATINKEVRGD